MPRKVSNALTPLEVTNAKPGRYADGGGLNLLVKDTGARSWVYRFMLKGRSRDIGLGAAGKGGVSLSDARDLAAALRLKVKAGIDPLEERERLAKETAAAEAAAAANRVTFKAAAEAHIKANEGSWRNEKHRQQWRNTLKTYAYPIMGDLPVGEIDVHHVRKVLDPIWQTKPETASRVRGRIETVLDSARVLGQRTGDNPARWRGHLAISLRRHTKRGHHEAMPYEDVRGLIGSLRTREAMAALALEFVILTASRTSEVLGAKWSEIDLEKKVWTVPADRMKARREHRAPLSPRAVEILETVKSLSKEWVFPSDGGGPLSNMAMAMLLRRMKLSCTVHGFRSAFRDWAAECTTHSHEVCEMALAHAIGNKVEAAYRRGDLFEKRRKLMEAWAGYVEPKARGGNVSPFQRAANA
jgi:integrase